MAENLTAATEKSGINKTAVAKWRKRNFVLDAAVHVLIASAATATSGIAAPK